MKKVISIFCFVCSALFFTACEDDVEIETGEATNITMRSANVSCRIVSSDVNLSGAECGVLYSKSKGTVEDGAGAEAKSDDFNGKTFSAALIFTTTTDYEKPGTKIYYRGYVQVGNDTYYGNVRSLYTGSN